MANTTGVSGALFDPSTSLGGLSTGIGWGTNAVYGPPVTAGMDSGDAMPIWVIGSTAGAAGQTKAQACASPGFPAAISIATSAVAAGGAMPDGSTNLSGKAVPAGGAVFGVTTAPAEVADWQARVTSNGGSVSAATATAVGNFVTAAKANGYWNKINRMNLFCGNNLAACLVPLKVGSGGATDINNGFVAGDYLENKGLPPNGAKYLDTGLVPSAALTLNDTHFAIYGNLLAPTGGGVHMGAKNTSTSTIWLIACSASYTAMGIQYDDSISTSYNIGNGNPCGLVIDTRTSSSVHTLYQNGVTRNTVAGAVGTLPSFSTYVLAYNNAGTAASIAAGGASTFFAGYSIGSGLTAADAAAYNSDMRTFQTALGRAVN